MSFTIVTVLLAASPALPIRTPTPFVHEMHDTENDAELTVERTIPFQTVFDVMQQHTEHLHECRSRLGTASRDKALMIFDVAPNGTVRNVGVHEENASIATEPVVHCFAKELRTWAFPKTAKGERGILLPFAINKPTLPVRSPGTVPAEDVTNSLLIAQKHRRELAHCAPKKKPTTRVRFNFVWDVTESGIVSKLGIEDETRASDPVALCLSREISTWSFPPELSPRTALSFAFAYGPDHAGDYIEFVRD